MIWLFLILLVFSKDFRVWIKEKLGLKKIDNIKLDNRKLVFELLQNKDKKCLVEEDKFLLSRFGMEKLSPWSRYMMNFDKKANIRSMLGTPYYDMLACKEYKKRLEYVSRNVLESQANFVRAMSHNTPLNESVMTDDTEARELRMDQLLVEHSEIVLFATNLLLLPPRTEVVQLGFRC